MKLIRWLFSNIVLIAFVLALTYAYVYWDNLTGEDTPAGKAIAYLSVEYDEVREFLDSYDFGDDQADSVTKPEPVAKVAETASVPQMMPPPRAPVRPPVQQQPVMPPQAMTPQSPASQQAARPQVPPTAVMQQPPASQQAARSQVPSTAMMQQPPASQQAARSQVPSTAMMQQTPASQQAARSQVPPTAMMQQPPASQQAARSQVPSTAMMQQTPASQQAARQQAPPQAMMQEPPARRPMPQSVTPPVTPARPSTAADAEKPAPSTRELWISAREEYHRGNIEGSITNYRQVIASSTDNYDAYGELGNVYLSRGKYRDAASAYFEAASILVKLGQTGRARSMLPMLERLDRSRAEQLHQLINTPGS
jgi:hypothetical protein